LNKVVTPNVIGPQRSLSHTTILTAAKVYSPTFLLLSRHLHPFLPPQALDSLVVDFPASLLKRVVNPRTTKTGSLSSNPPHFFQEFGLVRSATPHITLRATRLTQDTAGTTLRNLL
jgi:hypothetical protein